MPLLVRMFRESESEVQNCEHLILTLGTSYEPIVFSILGLRPKKILILFTAETRDKLDDVIYFTGIKASQYTLEEVDYMKKLKIIMKSREGLKTYMLILLEAPRRCLPAAPWQPP